MSQGVRSLNEHVTEMQKVHNCGKHAQATALNELGKYLTELEDENVIQEKIGYHIQNSV